VGTLGLVDHLEYKPPGVHLTGGSTVVLIGPQTPSLSLAGSKWAAERRGHLGGQLPDIDYEMHARLLNLVARLVAGADQLVDGIHDVSEGGLGVALAEMAVRGGTGFTVDGIDDHTALFGEGPSRVVLSVPADAVGAVQAQADAAGVAAVVLGRAGGDRLVVEGLLDVSLADAIAAWRGALPHAMGAAGA
jgi:phosphoribosylformylglycinamidine synthase